MKNRRNKIRSNEIRIRQERPVQHSDWRANLVRDHSSIMSTKRWVGGVRKWQFFLIYSTIYADIGRWVGGLKKPKTYWHDKWMVPKGLEKNSTNESTGIIIGHVIITRLIHINSNWKPPRTLLMVSKFIEIFSKIMYKLKRCT